jgi:hypothetical protein
MRGTRVGLSGMRPPGTIDQDSRQDRRQYGDDSRRTDSADIPGPRIETEGEQLPDVDLRADPSTERPEALQVRDQERARYQDRLATEPLMLT